jgi:PEP-CTERM motif
VDCARAFSQLLARIQKAPQKMKALKKLALLCSMLALSAPAWSIPLSSVGGVDDLLGQTTLGNSGVTTEVSWLEGVLGVQIDESLYTQTDVTAGDWMDVDGMAGVFAIDLAEPVEWFLIKIGNNSGATSTHFVFNNLDSLSFAVIDLVEMGFSTKNTLNIGKVSHVGTGAATTVPEPGTLALLGLGLLGCGAMRRRQAN